jgi:hypothetical protein
MSAKIALQSGNRREREGEGEKERRRKENTYMIL